MKSTKSLAFALIVLVLRCAMAPVHADNGTIVSSFPADSGPSHKDHPDTAGAVGPKHVVDFDDANFVVHDKATGKVLLKKSQHEFWISVEPPIRSLGRSFNDPRILYEQERWLVT